MKKIIFVATGEAHGSLVDSTLTDVGKEQMEQISRKLKEYTEGSSVHIICPNSTYGQQSGFSICSLLDATCDPISELYPKHDAKESNSARFICAVEDQITICKKDVLIVVTSKSLLPDAYFRFYVEKFPDASTIAPPVADNRDAYVIDNESGFTFISVKDK